jgi:hypothetical protein
MSEKALKFIKKRRHDIRKERDQVGLFAHTKILLNKFKAKRERRKSKADEREKYGEESVPKGIPRTIENTQEPDDTYVLSDDEEVCVSQF